MKVETAGDAKSERNHDYKAGSLIVFSEGEYSDYGYSGHFVVLRDMGLDAMRAAAAGAFDGEDYGYRHFRSEAMIAGLIREGYLLELNCREIHLGCYGRCDPDFDPHP